MSDETSGRVLAPVNDTDGNLSGYHVECPGCGFLHFVRTVPHGNRPVWTFDGSMDAPTFSPSLLVHWEFENGRPTKTCHSFIRSGKWQFLSDCTHALAGQTVPMVPVDEESER